MGDGAQAGGALRRAARQGRRRASGGELLSGRDGTAAGWHSQRAEAVHRSRQHFAGGLHVRETEGGRERRVCVTACGLCLSLVHVGESAPRTNTRTRVCRCARTCLVCGTCRGLCGARARARDTLSVRHTPHARVARAETGETHTTHSHRDRERVCLSGGGQGGAGVLLMAVSRG